MRQACFRGLKAAARARSYICTPAPALAFTPAYFLTGRALHHTSLLHEADKGLGIANMLADDQLLAENPEVDDAAETEVVTPTRQLFHPKLQKQDSIGSSTYGKLDGITLDTPDEELSISQDGVLESPKAEAVRAAGAEEIVEQAREVKPIYEFAYSIPVYPTLPSNVIRKTPPPMHWSHKLYRGPKGQTVIVDYCRTLERSESVAKEFLNEKIIGFDMEWAIQKSAGIKKNVSLISVASAERIALFHIALHQGSTVDKLIAPTLRRIIESPSIMKSGVSVFRADATRLLKYTGVEAQGLVELSNLHNLIEDNRGPDNTIKKTLKALSELVNDYLGLPLLKDSVRTSDWSRPLNQSQIDYAAADAFAGFMLYHVLNNKRISLDPTPPHPPFAELRQPIIGIERPKDKSKEQDADDEDIEDDCTGEAEAGPRKKARTKPEDELDSASLPLFEELKVCRQNLADANRLRLYNVASNQVLKDIAVSRPKTFEDLKQVKGIGNVSIQKYGASWLQVVHRFESSAITPDSLPPGAEGSLQGMRFVFTGIVGSLSRTEVQELVEKCGGEVMKEPNQTTTYVVTGRDVSQRKLEAIAAHKLPVIGEATFFNLIHQNSAERMLNINSTESLQAVTQSSTTTTPSVSTKTPLPPLQYLIGAGAASSTPINTQQQPPNPFLNALFDLRTRISALSKLPPNMVASDSVLVGIAKRRPPHRSVLLQIPGAMQFDKVARLHNIDLIGFVVKHTSPPASATKSASASAVTTNSGRANSLGSKTEPTTREAGLENSDADSDRSSGFIDISDIDVAPPPAGSRSSSRSSSDKENDFESAEAPPPQPQGEAAKKPPPAKKWVYGEFSVLPPVFPKKRKF